MPRPFDLQSVMQDVTNLLGLSTAKKGLDLLVRYSPETPRYLVGDATRIRQVLLNLVGNAIKFTAESEAAGFAAYLTKPVYADKLIETIARVVTVAVADSPVPRHPADAGAEEAGQQQECQAANRPHINEPLCRVLIADDNTVNLKVGAAMLGKLECSVELAADGQEALDLLARSTYDVIFMDCEMPRLDGYEATREIRRRESPNQHIPIIALTAHALEGIREKCMDAGMDDYLTKPVQFDRLRAVLGQWRPERRAASA